LRADFQKAFVIPPSGFALDRACVREGYDRVAGNPHVPRPAAGVRKSAANEKIALVAHLGALYIRAMKTWQSFHPDHRWRPASRPSATRLAAGLLVAAFGFGAPAAFGQQSQPAPQTPPAAGGGQAPPELEMTERQFQNWILRCGRSQEGPEVCEMQQQTKDNQGRTVMAVAVGTVPGSSDLGLLIILPLGISQPAGVSLAIDGGEETPHELDRCERQGCRVEMLIPPELLNRLKSGREAKVFFEADDPQGERRRLGVPISLLGFTAALGELTG
jgi:invasion protein IalB